MILQGIKNLLPRKFPPQEVFEAYWNKLPDRIQVKWLRDGDFIIGEITMGDYSFKTQAESAKEFVEMVNDAIFVVCEIPKKYYSLFEQKKIYPTKEQFERLKNLAIKNSSFDFDIKKEYQYA